MAGTRTISDLGGNYSSNGAWAEGSPPDITMDVVATGTSGPITVDTLTCVCKTMVLTGYTGTMTFTAGKGLTVSGNVTFASGMTITGTGGLTISATATLTSAGKTFTGALAFGANSITFGDNWTISGMVYVNSGVVAVVNGSQIICNGGLTVTGSCSGTTNFILGGGTWSGANTTGISNNLSFNGNVTLSGSIYYSTGTLSYISGTIITGTSTLIINGSCTLNANGMSFANFTNVGNITITLQSNISISSTFYMQNNNLTFSGAYSVSCAYMQIGVGSLNLTLTLVSGQTLTITSGIYIGATYVTGRSTQTIRSSVASSPAHLAYQGTQANSNIMGAVFTDINASGSVRPLYNYQGGVLTRTSNIYNVVLPPATFQTVNGSSFIRGSK